MTVLKTNSRPRRFVVIGAGGPAGLATMKVFSEELQTYIRAGDCELVGIEQRDDLGGVWLADKSPAPGNKWPGSPIYDSLRTNIAHPFMLYPSHLAPPSTLLYTDAQFIKNYLQGFADRFDLRQYIRFNSPVVSATWGSSIEQWKVVHQSGSKSDHTTKHISFFDHLLITNGHHHHPLIPKFDGFDAWANSESRSHMHSIWYHNAEPYRGLNVLIIGGGRSVSQPNL